MMTNEQYEELVSRCFDRGVIASIKECLDILRNYDKNTAIELTERFLKQSEDKLKEDKG